MYELAKKSRENMKAKARRLAGERVEKVDSSDWSPAPLLRAEIKTGARPIMRPSSKGIGESNAARDTKSAIGDAKRGAYKSGGAVKDAGVKDKKALGAIDPSPKRGPAGHYKKGGKVKRADGGQLPDPWESMRSEERLKGIKVKNKEDRRLPSAKEAAESAARVGDVPEGRKSGGKKWIKSAIEKPGALRKSLGVKKGEKIPAKKLAAAAEKGGKLGKRARLAQTLGRLGKATGGGLFGALKKSGKSPKKSAKTDINIVIKSGAPAMPQDMAGMMAQMGAPAMPPMPPVPMGAGAPPPAQMPGAFKKGGRVGKFNGGPMIGADPMVSGIAGMGMTGGPVSPGAPPRRLPPVQAPPVSSIGTVSRPGAQPRRLPPVQAPPVSPGAPPRRLPPVQAPPVSSVGSVSPGASPINMPAMEFPPMGGFGFGGPEMGFPPMEAPPMGGLYNLGQVSPGAPPMGGLYNLGQVSPGAPPMGGAYNLGPVSPGAPPMGRPSNLARPMSGMRAATMPLARKSGGRITKVASSYKDMEAGAASGEGRLQKTDIAKKHKDAPARKVGGRISKVASSYKDMTAGAASGEGRLQKKDIAKKGKGAPRS